MITHIKKALNILSQEGPSALYHRLNRKYFVLKQLFKINHQYQIWIKKNCPSKSLLSRQHLLQKTFRYRPKISIITPVYNPDQPWIESCIKSVVNQSYDNWELCLADDKSTKAYVRQVLEKYQKQDKRIKVVFRPQNGHISNASNSALKLATGEFIALLDHDDDLSPNSLYEIVSALNKNKQLDFLYSDEDKLELNGKHVDPFFKPDWSPDMLLSNNYICHLAVIRKKLIDTVGGFRVGYEGSQDYDLFLRITELTKNIHHIPKILYSWRKLPGSTATTYSVKSYAHQASINALNDVFTRKHIKGAIDNGLVEGTFRFKYKIIGSPLISIIIPTKDKIEYLRKCIDSVIELSSYQNYEILIVDTGSIEKMSLDYLKNVTKNKKIKVINWVGDFNYSAVNNFAVKKAKGDYVLLLNNDTQVISPDWIESMLEHAQRIEVGAVGAKLLYPNGTIQHAGVIMGIGGVANHASLLLPDEFIQVFPVINSKDIVRNFSAVTAACLLISKEKYLAVGGLDNELKIAFNDVDLCLKLNEIGYYNVYTPFAKLYHHESISIGKPQNGTRNIKEFHREVKIMQNKWRQYIQNDPYYNPNLTLDKADFSLKL
jgi:glycosyltransferase involved in cell wall biosynthesis